MICPISVRILDSYSSTSSLLNNLSFEISAFFSQSLFYNISNKNQSHHRLHLLQICSLFQWSFHNQNQSSKSVSRSFLNLSLLWYHLKFLKWLMQTHPIATWSRFNPNWDFHRADIEESFGNLFEKKYIFVFNSWIFKETQKFLLEYPDIFICTKKILTRSHLTISSRHCMKYWLSRREFFWRL